jgi:hypothetical protein
MVLEPQVMDAPIGTATLAAFLDELTKKGQPLNGVFLFHAVRNLPYLSTGDRSIEGILTRRAGSCSSKHILLAELLNHAGVKAQVELVLGDFATPFRVAHKIPISLANAARDGIRDIHNVVRADINGASVILDATWHDAMLPFAMRVNNAWTGQVDTEIAVDVQKMLGPSIDPAEDKARIIASWPQAEQQRRRRFLETVNEWVANITPIKNKMGEETWQAKQ